MGKVDIQLSELFIAKDNGRSTIKLFTASPTPLEEKNLGTLFAILEIDSQGQVNEEILNIIIDEIDNHYYQSESFEVEGAFETALQKTNLRLQEVVGEIGEEWLQQLNVVVGVQKGEQLVFANIGRVIALMIYHGRVVDVLDTTHAKAQDINPVKIFNNIVAGEVNDDNVLLFATETILDYLSKEKIKRILLDKDGDETIDEFHTLLGEDTGTTNFAALVLRKIITPQEEPQVEEQIPVVNAPVADHAEGLAKSVEEAAKNDSMSQLLGRESQTEELLTSSIWPSLKKRMRESVSDVMNRKKTITPPQHNGVSQSPMPAMPQETTYDTDPVLDKKPQSHSNGGGKAADIAGKAAKGLGSVLLALFAAVQKGIVWVYSSVRRTIKNRGGNGAGSSRGIRSQRSLQRSANSAISAVVRWFTELSRIQKVFFVTAIVLLLVFAQSVVNRGEQQIDATQEESFASQLEQIDAKINEGKAAVYYDTDQARTFLIDAQTMLSEIPQESDAYAERGEELQNTINNQLKLVNNVITLQDPSPALDFSAVNPAVELSNIILLGASVYAFDANNTSVYRGNLEESSTSVAVSDPGDGSTVVSAKKASPGTGIVVLSNETFATFNPVTQSLDTVDLQYPAGEHSIVDLSVYGSRLYTLDPKTNDIYRHDEADGGFTAGTGWLNDTDASLENGVSIAIDGEIYVLRNNGNVTRFSAGVKDDGFSLSDIDPALNSGTAIYTDENTENLYVLDSQNSRVVVFTKEGKLVAQYTSNTFDNLRSMAVDEANNRIYVLSGTRVYEVELQDAPEAEAAPVEAPAEEQ